MIIMVMHFIIKGARQVTQVCRTKELYTVSDFSFFLFSSVIKAVGDLWDSIVQYGKLELTGGIFYIRRANF